MPDGHSTSALGGNALQYLKTGVDIAVATLGFAEAR